MKYDFLKKVRGLKRQVIPGIMFILIVLSFPPLSLWCEEEYVNSLETPVHQSIDTRKQSQAELDKWEEERIQLQARFETLTKENEALSNKRDMLEKQKAAMKERNATLVIRERESRRIAEEMSPFIEDVFERFSDFIESDTPFLKAEREQRLARLKTVMDDIEVSSPEKFRKVMEALFIEAEYGNTIEVYQEKIRFGEEEILGDIFRLGRISLFFLSLDQETAAYYNVAEKKWSPLDSKYAPVIHAAIEMGGKRRPTELLCLPVGKLAVQSGQNL